jgi:hypothetical protein
MSAPPIGMVSVMPRPLPTITSSQKSRFDEGYAHTPQPSKSVAAARPRLIQWRLGWVQGFLNCGSSSSLPKATRLPQKVTAPIRPVSAVAIANWVQGGSGLSATLAAAVAFQSSAPATKVEAAPPKPLSRATICGMPVIGYLTAIRAPTAAPIAAAMPTSTSGHAPRSANDSSTGFSKQAAIKAIAIPTAPR